MPFAYVSAEFCDVNANASGSAAVLQCCSAAVVDQFEFSVKSFEK